MVDLLDALRGGLAEVLASPAGSVAVIEHFDAALVERVLDPPEHMAEAGGSTPESSRQP